MVQESADALRPPERLTVSEAAVKYRQLYNPGSYIGPWTHDLTPYLIETMDALVERDKNACVFVGPAQCGKPLSLDTPIATPSGWTTMGEIAVGDTVFSADGSPVQVIGVSPVHQGRQCYRVVFDDNSEIVADEGHLWVVDDEEGVERVVETRDFYERGLKRTSKGGLRSRYAIKNPSAIQCAEKPLPIDPYTLGLWLAEGHNAQAALTLNVEDSAHLCEQLCERGTVFKVGAGKGNSARSADRVALVLRHQGSYRVIEESGAITPAGKQIPVEYLRASAEQRRDLLRGLMDGDGTVANGTCQFNTSYTSLAEGFGELLSSLGIKYRHRRDIPTYTYLGEKREGRLAHTFSFVPADPRDCFTLPRQIEKFLQHTRTKKCRPGSTSRRFLKSVLPVDSVPVRCIAVAHPSHLFLAGRQMIPTHNTEIIINWLGYSVRCDPADFIIYQTSQGTARDFSKRRIDRLHRHSPEIGNQVVTTGGHNDNTFDKHYKSGVMLTLSWPSINELSGRPVGRVALTDYDRMPENIDGEGAPFDLARKRTTTFGSFAMTLAESSPGHEVSDPKWLQSTPHEAPPCPGILALYNRGDRRRWYWPCVHCREYFQPEFKYLTWKMLDDPLRSAETVMMECPHCHALISPDDKHGMNQRGRWLKEGQSILPDGTIIGEGVRSDIASFWLKGVAAGFASWKTLVVNFIKAEQEFEKTGSQEALKSTVNTDQGEPYYPRGAESMRSAEEIKSNSVELEARIVPPGVRFLTAQVDVQKNRWEVQVHGIGVGGDVWVIDRFAITKSKRTDEDGDVLWVKPAAYLEDWDLLIEQVIEKTYPLADGSGEMQVKLTLCDSGGKAGVTTNAYNFWRRLRDDKEGRQHHTRFLLVKGEPKPGAPRAVVDYPDSMGGKDKMSGARGEIPVLFLNVNILKDALNGMLDRKEPKGGKLTMPSWLPDEFFTELTVERRGPRGWENPRKYRNEAWDLLTYCLGALVYLRVEAFDWSAPPKWAEEWPKNILVKSKGAENRFASKQKMSHGGLRSLGGTLA